MMTEPVIVPTSGTSENRNARKASTAGNGAWMIDRKMKLSDAVDGRERHLAET